MEVLGDLAHGLLPLRGYRHHVGSELGWEYLRHGCPSPPCDEMPARLRVNRCGGRPLSKQRSTPTDSGWYANGNHEDTLQWWDGTEWVAAGRRVDGSTLPRPAAEDAWDPTERLIGSMWTQAASTARDYGQAFQGKSR